MTMKIGDIGYLSRTWKMTVLMLNGDHGTTIIMFKWMGPSIVLNRLSTYFLDLKA